jgi:phosphatidylglycerophosphatase A
MNIRKILSGLISTGFYFGKIPIAPGTIGSLMAFPIWILIAFSASKFGYLDNSISSWNFFYYAFFIIFVLFTIGTYSVSVYQSYTGTHDAGEIIIDEIVAQLLVIQISIFLSPFFFKNEYNKFVEADLNSNLIIIIIFITNFICFRIFDILKPWPISLVDQKCKGAIGVMMDDIVAIPFTVLTSFASSFMIMDLLFYYAQN